MFENIPGVKACCKNEKNLYIASSKRAPLTIRKCLVCNRNHYELEVDPGKVGVTAAKVG